VAGCIGAANRWQDTAITLVGPGDVLEAELDKHGPRPPNIEVAHASEVIGMHESPVRALRGKRDSSINVGMKIVADGQADAFLSAGNTGAVVAAGSLRLGLMEGVQRPGIAVPMIAIDHPILVIDVGANVHCKPPHLLQYALMADVFARNVMDMTNPRVGLLNVGEEERKGTELEKEAYGLLADAPLNFVGNVESDDVFFGGCDIVVCDGFVGNILLKTSESMVKKVLSFLREEISKKWRRRIGFALCKDVFKSTQQVGDYAEYGGAPLLGVDGVTIICHGRSEARAFENAVREARSFLSHKVNHSIGEAVRACLPSREKTTESTRPAAS
jgi:glycerol-3-phosphate acyltransferase PlsX